MMFKKLLLTCLVFYSATIGLNVVNVSAAAPVGGVNGSAVQNGMNGTDDSQQADNEANISQTTPSNEKEVPTQLNGEGSTDGQQENVIEVDKVPVDQASKEGTDSENKTTQDQSSDTKVTQNQNVTGGDKPDQNQNANVSFCQDQYVNKSASCEEVNSEGQANQSQKAAIDAAQGQTVVSSEDVTAKQNQDTDVNSKQTQVVSVNEEDSQSNSQGTNATTDQSQFVTADDQAFIVQGQLAQVGNSQQQQLDTTGAKENGQKQQTSIKELQIQTLSTSGSAKMEQTQSAEVKGNIVDTLKKVVEEGVVVTTRNYIEVIKDQATHAVKMIQEIIVNNELVDKFDQWFSLENQNSQTSHQKFEKQYSWGALVVENSGAFMFSEPLQHFDATMTSYLFLNFGLEKFEQPDPNQGGENPGDNGGGDVTPPGDNDGTPTDAGTVTPPGDNGGTPAESEGEDTVAPTPAVNGETPVDTKNGDTVTKMPVATEVASAEESKAQLISISKENTREITPVSTKGNQLPDTSTEIFNNLIYGLLLVSAGGIIYFLQRRNA